ncbi:AMID-like mitochondrial oxidoreductase-like protein [Polyplosphaeria fusca]|uniref:AMID-like mitochondrial oxidoreductase-like protein n=1 Tax=Polyplosphaeria fusca TaxID=682080 RepID=A0A9P4R357_9PLEO|nr:AMID-like mitochondrial oxidoreductase-like protein [Polyplosphaeria fusca]
MAERNIVILGASSAGLQAAHYSLKHLLPTLNAKGDAKYHVYMISPASHWYFRFAAPRASASLDLMPEEKIFYSIDESFKAYPKSQFTFIQAPATGLDTTARTVTYQKTGQGEQQLPYHALIVATGSSTFNSAMHSDDKDATLKALKTINSQLKSAHDIIIVGGGPSGVETAGEIGEFVNGKPGWFSSPARKANITLVTAGTQLLPTLRPAIGKQAEDKLTKLGVDVQYNTRVANSTPGPDGRTIVTLGKGEKLEADLYIDAHGVRPNSSFLPPSLLNEHDYLITNNKTLRVDAAGPRVYGLGDVASYSRNTVLDVIDSLPVVMTNMKRDLLSFNASSPDAKPKGQDREYAPKTKEMMITPVGRGGGVGAIMGWKVPSWFVWLLKGRDYMVGMNGLPVSTGKTVAKEFKWTAAEAVL